MPFREIPKELFAYKQPVLVEIVKRLAENDWALHAEGDFAIGRLSGDILKTIIHEKIIERIKIDKLITPIWDCDAGSYLGTGSRTFQEIELPNKTFKPSIVVVIGGPYLQISFIFHGEDSVTSSLGLEPYPEFPKKTIDSFTFYEGREEILAFQLHWALGKLTPRGFKVTGELNFDDCTYEWIAFGNV
jgi:hypothetical protein